MGTQWFTLFDTAIGRCGIVWGAGGILGMQLPEGHAGAALAGIAIDMERVPEFHRRVYDVARTIPPGATLSYGDIATRLGAPGSARAVGQALGRNPFPIVVPCHRVLASNGKMGGFSANG